MEKQKGKLKVWYEEHKDGIKTEVTKIAWYGLGIGVGYFCGSKIKECQAATSIGILHNLGIVKFFDPSKGLAEEISVSEAIKVAERMRK